METPPSAARPLMGNLWGHTCVFLSWKLTLSASTSLSDLSPDLDSPGVKSRAQWTQSLSSSMTVTETRSNLRVSWRGR